MDPVVHDGPVLRLTRVQRVFGQKAQTVAVADASLEVWPGELVSIVGPSGSGKSTLLNIMGLLDRPSSGTVEILGRDVSRLTERQRDLFRGRHIGFVFQASHVIGHQSTAANIALGLRIQGVSPRARTARVQDLLSAYGLDHRGSTPGALLSGGERQRAGIARSVAGKPSLVLADEPTGNLDSRNSARVMEELTSLARSGAAVVVITHDTEVASAADRILTVRDGELTGERMPARTLPTAQARRSATPASPAGGVVESLEKSTPLSRAADALAEGVNSLWASVFRSLLLIVAFALGVGGLVATTGISDTTKYQVSERIDAAGLSELTFQDLRAAPEGPPVEGPPAQPGQPEAVPAAPVPSPEDVQRVRDAVERLDGVTLVGLRGKPEDTLPVSRLVALAAPRTVAVELVDSYELQRRSGRNALPLWDDPHGGHQVVLGEEAARALGVARAAPNVLVHIGTVQGSVARVLPASGDPFTDHAVFVNPVMGARLGRFSLEYTVSTKPGYPSVVGEAIPKTLSPGAPAAIRVQTTADLRNLKRGVGGDLALMVGVLSLVLLVLSSLTAATSMYISVFGRTAEISLRRALGQGRVSIGLQFINEGALLGFLGGLLGVVVGVLCVVVISMTNGWAPVLDPVMMTLVGVGMGLAVGAISSVVPAVIAARVEPAMGLRA